MKKNKKGITQDKNKKWLFVLNILFMITFLVCFGIFAYSLFQVNVIPTKFLGLGIIGITIIFGILLFLIFKRKKIFSTIISYIIMVLLSITFVYVSTYFNNTYHFFQGTQVKDYDTLHYSVVVLKENQYQGIKSLKNKTISYLEDDYTNDIQINLNKNIDYTEKLSNDFGSLSDDLLEKKTDAICLEESYLMLVKEEVEDFEEKTEILDTFEVQVKSHQEDGGDITSITDTSFILYISGIDQYGNVNSVRGRSDVNQFAVINTRTNHILLVNTPRDYYVQLAGTTGLKDKLTHAGIYGIGKSIATLENLYKMDISHYLRVNFDTLIKVVDIIGGIDIYSDSEFTCWTNRNVHVQKGWNHFNGKEALAYSRERHAYLTGDHHRGANQQQVITAIINKVSQSSVLISKYNSILNALDGSFQTDMPTGMITSFIKYQLDSMPTWNIESIAVTGSNSMDYTYSMGMGRKLYVMEPNYESVEIARKKIQEVYNEK